MPSFCVNQIVSSIIDLRFDQRQKVFAAVIVCGLTLLIGWLDWITPAQMSFLVFYWIPVAILTWVFGVLCGYGLSFLCVLSITMMEMVEGRLYAQPGFFWWELITRLTNFFLLVTVLWLFRRAVEERYRAEAAIRRREGLFRRAVEISPIPMLLHDEDDLNVVLSRGWTEYSGYTLQEIPTLLDWREKAFGERTGADRRHIDELFQGNQTVANGEWPIRAKNGQTRIWDFHTTPLGKITGGKRLILCTAIDVTERKLAEDALRQDEQRLAELNADLEREVVRRAEALHRKEAELEQTRRLEAVGRLAGGVAHDFNNLLTGIVGIAQEAHDRMPMQDPLREELDMAIKAGQRGFSLTRQLLTFSRRETAVPKVVNLNGSITEFQKLLSRLIGEDIRLHADLRPESGNIRIDPGQLEQVIVNLAVNARDAMPEGGDLWIETAEHVEEAGPANSVPPGHYARVTMRDSGLGMSPETLEHMFEPFFTTKGCKGSGLGLSTVYGIVQQNAGYVCARSNEGMGTTIDIYLPYLGVGQTDERRFEARKAVRSGNETVLVVEDEEIVRHVTTRMLRRHGYNVLEAPDAKHALELTEHLSEPVHLLLTDVVMPGMNGRELAELLEKKFMGLRVLYMSGYTQDVIDSKGISSGRTHFIEKPALYNYLLRKVREVLDSPKRALP